MAEYTIRNLLEIEDAAPRFGMAPGLEARFARGELGLEKSGLSYQRLAPDARTPFGHSHREQEEVYVVVGGAGRVALGDEVVDVRQWDAIRVPPETRRCFEAGDGGLELLAFGAPATPPGDADLAPGWWPRETS